jgi:Uma2 family endonuclease
MYDEKENDDLEVREALPDYDRLYTVEEYYNIDDDIRAELYEGYLVVMQTPTLRHQGMAVEFATQLHTFLKGKNCKVYNSPGVHLFEKEATVFIPDIVVVCDKSKLGIRSVEGTPDFVIEILSPSTKRMDRKLKFDKYLKAGVKEYWIVDPERNLLEANLLVNDKYITTIYNETDKAPVTTLDGFEIDLAEVFAE